MSFLWPPKKDLTNNHQGNKLMTSRSNKLTTRIQEAHELR